MENGLQEFAEQMLATAVVGKDQDVVKVLTSVEVGDDLKDTTMTEVVEEKVGGGGGAEGGEGEEEEDVYSMEVSDELEKRNEVVAKEAESTAVAVAPPELDKNDDFPKEEDVTMSTINDEPTSESGAATERGPAEIPFAEPAAGAAAAAASEKEDVTDLNETPKLELENESEEMRVNEASPTPPTHDLVEAAEELEVPQESPAKSEAVKDEVVERVIRPALDVNEPAEALKTVEGVHSDVAPFRNVRAEEAKALHDAETKMVSAAACVANEAMESAHEDVRAAAQGEEEVAQVKLEPKDEGQSSGQVDDIRSSQSQPNGGADMAVDAKEGDAGVVPKAEKTELEREMELYEASEREEQVWLLAPTRVEQQCEEPSKDVQNDRKRALDMPTQERQRKQSRRTHAAEERKKDEEDVCFICFDGGDLVMCDRRSCPKAYHLSCIGRDAAFFKKKGAWLCGWHFCSVCTKPGSFQCYTCPTAYCGSCIQEAEFLMLRKRKGLCEDCLPIVSMIERNETTNADGVEVDFEDQDTYECLFKEYWEDLKRRLSLIMPELDKDGKPVGGMGSMLNSGGSETEDHSENEESDRESDESEQEHPEPVEAARKGRGKGKKDRMGSEKMEEDVDQEEGEEEGEGEGEEEEVQEQQEDRGDKFESWASQELLGFIEHMKEDPTKPLSRFAVNKLLWSYIKRHRLQDARKSSQINCDERLRTIFGKETVGQFEMFKHLQAHFPSRSSVDSKKSKDSGKGDEAATEDEALDGGEDVVGSAKERRRGRRAADEKFERPSSSEYAAITPKNISLIYLRRALLRDLLDDPEFDNKVVDTFVRIRVPGISTKTETTYRLVLVTGTRIGEESYKAGTKTTNIVLEILNLQKKEDVTVDLVSNQDFTEEECQRLRQSIKCGFIKALTVGEVEEKALALQEARVNDWFENERQRLINLRDRASEQGRKKELRECVEKLQELSSPAFRAAKLQARPEVSADPHMDPGYESDVNEMSPLQVGGRMFRAKGAASSRWEKGGGSGGGGGGWDGLNVEESSFYPGRKGDADGQRSKSSWEETSRSRGYGRGGYDAGRSGEKVGAGRESSYGVEAKTYGSDERDRRVWDKDWDREQTREQERGRGDAYNWSSSGGRNGLDAWGGEVGEAKYGRGETRTGTTPVFGQPRTEWGSTRREAASTASVSSTPVGFGPATPSIQNLAALEKEKLWHYQDPTGTVQGPFTMEQLRKWNTTGLFPVTLTIWKTGQSQAESMLLTDALAGRWKEEIWGGGAGGAGRSRSRELVGGGSPTPRANSAWSVMEGGLGASRGEVGAAVSSTEWESRDAAERGGSWARVASSFGGVSSGSGRAVEEWSGARARAEPESWGGSSRKGDGSSWGGSESGKSTYGRSNSSREYEGAAGREGSRSSRGPRGSKKDVPCRFYAKGYCKRGDACEFWHG